MNQMDDPEVVFGDQDLMVLNKPPGWVVNRVDSAKGPVIQDWVEEKLGKPKVTGEMASDFSQRNGVVHRLDKETSGLLLVAKSEESFSNLTTQFADRKVKKRYLALVHGKMDQSGVIEEPLGRLPWNRERFGVLTGGRASKTAYKTLGFYQLGKVDKSRDRFGGSLSLVELSPQTGRTHQIRVHLKSIGHPLVSDDFYAGRKTARDDRLWCPRLFLHATYLGFFHPKTKAWMEFSLKLPSDLDAVLEKISRTTSDSEKG